MEQPKQRMRLQELFKSGELVSLEFPNPEDPDDPIAVEIWIRRPTPEQQQEAMAKAQAKKARKRRALKEDGSDDYAALMEDVETLESRDELIDQIIRFNEQAIRSRATNEVLYKEGVGSDWGKDAATYIEIIDAVQQRWQEIVQHNDDLAPEDQELRIDPEEDEELAKLSAEQEKFEAEVQEKFEELREEEKAKYHNTKISELREEFRNELINVQTGLEWYGEYRNRLLFYSLRDPENTKRFYFSNMEEMLSMPEFVQQRLFAEYDRIERGVDDVKNLLSPRLS